MLESTPVTVTVLLLAAATLIGVVVLARQLIDALHRVAGELNGLEATVEVARRDMDTRLMHLTDAARHHTSVTREVAATAPEKVIAERDQLAEDYQRLAGAAAVAIQYQPDPEAGVYVAAGVAEAIAHVKSHVQAAL